MKNQTYSITDDRGFFRSRSSVNPETFYETVAYRQSSEEEKISLPKEFWTAFSDGVFGGLTFMILIVYIFSNTLMAGHLHNSELYVEAFGIAGVYANIFTFFIWGFNSGFIVTASRCFGLGDYKGMHNFFIKQTKFIFGLLTMFFLYNVGIYFVLPVVYPGREMLIYWTRAYLVLTLPVNFSSFYMDAFRELFIANELFKPALYVETISMLLSFLICYILAFQLNFDFFGLVAGMIITQATCVGLYFGIWKRNRLFDLYWKNKDTEPIRIEDNYTIPLLRRATSAPDFTLKHGEALRSIHEKIEDSPLRSKLYSTEEGDKFTEDKTEGDIQEHIVDLKSNWGYFKFNIVFSLTMFLDGFWWQADAVICSFLFDGASIAAQTTLTQFLNVITLFGYGFTMTLSSKISQYLVILEVKKAKRITWIVSLELLIMGCLFAIPFVFFSDKISPIMIESVDTRIVLNKIMKIFGASIPLTFLSSVSFATNRSINNQNKYFICQIICNYGVHFGCFSYLKFWVGMGVESLWYAYFASQASITLLGFGMMFITDWKKEAENICKQMAGGTELTGF